MTLRHLQIFVAVYQENSITKAAEKLYIAQPAVSKYIREIEETYGCRLFERFSRKLVVTPFGEDFYSYAVRITSLYEEMNFAMESFPGRGQRLRIGSGTAIGHLYLPKVVKSFADRHPHVEISLISGNIEMIEAHLMDNTLDFAIMEWMHDSPRITHTHLEREQIVVVCNASHPLAAKSVVTAEDLAGVPLLLREPGCQLRRITDEYFSMRHLEVTPFWESNSTSVLINAVCENLGVSFLTSRQLTIRQDPRLAILNVPDLVAERDVNVYYHRDKRIFPLMLEFLRHYRAFTESLDQADSPSSLPI